MGSLCCVVARPHGTSSTNREWPLTPTDPFWCTNTSFSLTPCDSFYRYHSFPSYGSQSNNDGTSLNYASSDSLGSSNSSKGSRSWERSEVVTIDDGFEGVVSNFSSSDGGFESWQEQAVNVGGFDRVPAPRPLPFSSFLQGTSLVENSDNSTTSLQSNQGTVEYNLIAKSPQLAPRCLSTTCRSFTSKHVHPLSFRDDSSSVSCSTGSIVDPTEASDPSETLGLGPQCGICRRLLSRKSPWGPRKIVHTSDLPVVSILSCLHVYHAECLDRATSKLLKHDPTCPLCEKMEKDNCNTEQWTICRSKNGLPRLRSVGEGPSRVWSCTGGGDMVPFSKILLKRHVSQKESSRKSQV